MYRRDRERKDACFEVGHGSQEPVELLFQGEVNDLLGRQQAETLYRIPLRRRTSIKDLVESLGLPHTEVGHLEADGSPIGWDHRPGPGERIRVAPLQQPVDVRCWSRLHPHPLEQERFVVDVNVGKLARKLRLLGFDAAYHWTWTDEQIADIASREGRIVLTKDVALLKRRKVIWGRYLRAKEPEGQLLEVLSLFGLRPPFAVLSRCLDCNAELEEVDKQEILHLLEPKTKLYFDDFSRCPHCGKIYWAGSHQQRIVNWLQGLGLDGGER